MKLTRRLTAYVFLALVVPALCFPVQRYFPLSYRMEERIPSRIGAGNNAAPDLPGCPGGNPSINCTRAMIGASLKVDIYLTVATHDFSGHRLRALESVRKSIEVYRQAYLAIGGTDLASIEIQQNEPGFGLRSAVTTLQEIRQNMKQADKKNGYADMGRHRKKVLDALDEEIKQLRKAAEYEK